MKSLLLMVITAAVLSPAAFAQFGPRPFYCLNRYNTVNVEIRGNRYVATLNIPVSSDADGYMGEFVANSNQVIYGSNGIMKQMTATSATYYQSRWNPKKKSSENWRPGRSTLTIIFQAMEYPGLDIAIFATGILRQANGRTINFPLGWCRPPGT